MATGKDKIQLGRSSRASGGGKKGRQGTRHPSAQRPLLNVPWGSYDPSIDAQLRASQRGLSDMREDTRTADRWAKTDFSQRLADIGRGWQRNRADLARDVRRGRQDIGTRFQREGQKIRFRRQDLRRDASRGREDLAQRMAAVGRQFSQLASSQREAQNASGTLQGGAAAAAAEKRAENQQIAEQPIRTAEARLNEDLATSLGRLQVSENQLRTDTGRALGRLNQDRNRNLIRGRQDVRRDRRLSRRDFGRGGFDRQRKLQRGIREQRIGEADLLAQKIDSARQRNPGAFGRFGQRRR